MNRDTWRPYGRMTSRFGLGLALLLCLASFGETTVFGLPTPQVTLDAPAEALIGDSLTFTVKFRSFGAAGDIGYGPFVDLVLDAGGADINKACSPLQCDGITFVKAEMVGAAGGSLLLNSFPVSAPCNPTPVTVALLHPFAASGILPVTVPAGGQLITLALPFGSFDPTQPEITVEVTVQVSDLADAGSPLLTISARGGFRYGKKTPLDDPATDPPILSETNPNSSQWIEHKQIKPTVFTIKKEYLGPEDETATGPNFHRRYRITVDIADQQALNSLTIRDMLPANMQYVGIVQISTLNPPYPSVPTTGTSPPCKVPSDIADLVEPIPGPGGLLQLKFCVPVIGTPAQNDVTLIFEFFIPENDLLGNPVLPTDCQPALSINDIKAEGDWGPSDPCDTSPVHVVSDATPNDHTLMDKCIAIQKSVAIVNDTHAAGPTPGDTLQYTLDFQISDFRTFGNLRLHDLLSDGQTLNPASIVLTVTDQSGTTSGAVPATAVTIDPTQCGFGAPPPRTVLDIDVSMAMSSLATSAGGPPRHKLGILTGGYATAPPSSMPATVQIVFQAIIDDAYSCPVSPGDRFLDKDDPLTNVVTISSEVFTNAASPSPTGVIAADDSHAAIAIVTDIITKTVYAVKRGANQICGPSSTACPLKPQVQPGDEVTFRIEYPIPSSDAEYLIVQDWLPLPIFHVAGLGFTWGKCGIPASGGACLGPTDTMKTTSATWSEVNFGQGPTFTTDVSANSLMFDYGTFNDASNLPRKIDLLFTVTATNDAFADGLFLTNEALECEDNTFGLTVCQVAIAQVQMAEPNVRILKGVVATDSNGVFSPAPPPAGTFTPPGGPCPRFDGTITPINSSNLGALNLNSNISNVDASDLVTFGIVVENLGSDPNGAFDVKIRDIFPLDPTDLPTCFVPDLDSLCVTYGDGTAIPPSDYILTPGRSFTIELIDPKFGQGALAPFHPTSGKNIAIVTFDATIIHDIKSGCCENLTKLENYSNTEAGSNFVDAGIGGPFEDAAEVCSEPRPSAKCIQATSELHTTPPQGGPVNAAIGEIVRFRLVTVVPEGITRKFQVQDFLPPGLTYSPPVGNPSVLFVADYDVTSPPGIWPTDKTNTYAAARCPGPLPIPINALNVGGGPTDPIFFFPPSDIYNNDNDSNLEFAVIEFNAQVDNIPSNQNGTVLHNQFEVTYEDQAGNLVHSTSGSVDVTIVEPTLTLTKSVAPTTVTQGATVTYTVNITNVGTAAAFDVEFTDTFPAGLTYVPNSLTYPVGCIGSGGGLGVSVGCDSFLYGPVPVNGVVTITYQAVANPMPCPVTLTNQAKVTWTSLPGPHGTVFNPTGSSTVGVSGANDGERNGDDGPSGLLNDYAAIASAPLTVQCGKPCDLAITKVPDSDPILLGVPFLFVVTVTNVGDLDCVPNTTVTDNIPPGFTWTGWPGSFYVNTIDNWSCSNPYNINCTNTTLTLKKGQSSEVFNVVLTATQVPIENCATVTNLNDMNPNPANNTACYNGGITGPTATPTRTRTATPTPTPTPTSTRACDLAIKKTVDPNPPIAGLPFAFLVRVTNEGSVPCGPSTTVTDTLPSGFTVSASGFQPNTPDWVCPGLPPNIVCISTLTLQPSQPSLVFSVEGTATAGTIQNCAALTNGNDTYSNNNSDCATASVTGPTVTPTSTPTVTPTPTPKYIFECVGDCNGNNQVTVDELVKGVNIALGTMALDECAVFDSNNDRHVTVDELVKGVNNALNGCGA